MGSWFFSPLVKLWAHTCSITSDGAHLVYCNPDPLQVDKRDLKKLGWQLVVSCLPLIYLFKKVSPQPCSQKTQIFWKYIKFQQAAFSSILLLFDNICCKQTTLCRCFFIQKTFPYIFHINRYCFLLETLGGWWGGRWKENSPAWNSHFVLGNWWLEYYFPFGKVHLRIGVHNHNPLVLIN